MRFLKALIWLIIVTVPFIGFLYALAEFELPMIGQGNPIANVSYYILSQNENSPMYTNAVLRDKFAQQFIYLGVYKLLVFLLFFWVLLSLIWIILSEFLKIDRPGKAIKYTWLWFGFFIVSILIPGAMTWYFLYLQDSIWHYAELSRMISLIIFIFIYSGIYFYLSSVFITSRVMRPAVPLLTIILRN